MTWQAEKMYLNQELEKEKCMPTGDPYCSIHGLVFCNCGLMRGFKTPYKVPRLLSEISDQELIDLWHEAYTRGHCGDAECDPEVFRIALAKLLNV